MSEQKQNALTGGRCPICGKPAMATSRPFCSKRCGDIDLARWLSGGYAIAGGAADADEDGDDTAAGEAQKGGRDLSRDEDADEDL
jgi:endogenous inhibitor of DNA gyrase (YacG/DUF329 family)